MVAYTLVLIPASLMPFTMGRVGWVCAVGVVTAGAIFLYTTIAFARNRTIENARRVFHVSVVYLAAVILLFVLEATRHLGL
jgi:heme O synthase-like polyprenyltransferase